MKIIPLEIPNNVGGMRLEKIPQDGSYPVQKSECLFEKLGLKPVMQYHIPIKDENGSNTGKYLIVKEGGELYNKIMTDCDNQMPKSMTIINNE